MNEDFIPFELAKKLKEKGYPQHIADDAYIVDNYGEEDYQIGDRLPIPLIPDYMDDVSAPRIDQVLKWLREKHNILISPSVYGNEDGRIWSYSIINIETQYLQGEIPDNVESYEQAALAGIEYVLDDLI